MKIGIIVHSQSGHTFSVGETLRNRLESEGHEVKLMRMQTIEQPDAPKNLQEIELDSMPDVNGYEALVFGAWVEGFDLCRGFKKYAGQLPALKALSVSCFVTQQFRYKWMGGNRAMSKMTALLEAKGAAVDSTAIINWSHKDREQQIGQLVERFSRQYK
ncbi:flavodoxin family protein [Planococcus plakortidis]|uniref:flavodoxin family protein n=1 Tax=Planococcus plakortidis TaxID=1038856 RepID=UPI0039849827